MATYQLLVRAECATVNEIGREHHDNYRYVDTVRAVSKRHAIRKAIAGARERFAYRFAHRIAPKWEIIFDAEILANLSEPF